MVVHVGIDVCSNNVAIYNSETRNLTKRSINKVIYDNFGKVDAMFENLRMHLSDAPGCACIVMQSSNYGNEIRKRFLEAGKMCGFQKVEIIDWNTALYLQTILQLKEKPKNGDIIWIFNGKYFVWEIIDGLAKMISEQLGNHKTKRGLWQIRKNAKQMKDPDAIFIPNRRECEDLIKKLFHKCNVFGMVLNSNTAEGAVVKARIMGNDAEIMEFNAATMLPWEIFMKLENDKQILFINKNETLPIQKLLDISSDEYNNNLHIFFRDKNVEHCATENLPDFKPLPLFFIIDTNGIYNINYKEEVREYHDDNNFYTVMELHHTTEQNEDHSLPLENLTFNESSYIDLAKNFQIPRQFTDHKILKRVVGIDLGTSRCCLAVGRRNGIETVPIENTGERMMPSYVAFDEENEKCGQIVINRLHYKSQSTVFDVKRFIGKPYEYVVHDSIWPFKICPKNDKIIIESKGYENIIEKTPQEISAALLKHIKKKAEEFQGRSLRAAVITIPAAFTLAQKEATYEAAILAGWRIIRLLPEPIAAAFAYFSAKFIPTNSTILLIDLGGGTLDVCLFKIVENQIQIINNSGDTCLGGRDFDNSLFHYFEGILEKKYCIKIDENVKLKYRLIKECMEIKHNLSFLLEYNLNLDDFDINIEKEIIPISRIKFENLTKNLVLKIKTVIIQTLSDAGYHVDQINKVVQVGGSCRMPMIKDFLHLMFPKAQQCLAQHPDEIVAIGAAQYAYYLINQKNLSK